MACLPRSLHQLPNAPPLLLFLTPNTSPLQRKYEELGLEPYVAHATFQYSGTPGKRNRFREFLLWDDPPEYFDHPKGFITIKWVIRGGTAGGRAARAGKGDDELTISSTSVLATPRASSLSSGWPG